MRRPGSPLESKSPESFLLRWPSLQTKGSTLSDVLVHSESWAILLALPSCLGTSCMPCSLPACSHRESQGWGYIGAVTRWHPSLVKPDEDIEKHCLCMCVMCIFMYVHMHVGAHTYVCMFTCTWVHVHVYECFYGGQELTLVPSLVSSHLMYIKAQSFTWAPKFRFVQSSYPACSGETSCPSLWSTGITDSNAHLPVIAGDLNHTLIFSCVGNSLTMDPSP